MPRKAEKEEKSQEQTLDEFETLDPQELETMRNGMERLEADAQEGRKSAISLRYMRLCDSFSSELATYREIGIEAVLRGDSTSFKLIEALHKIGKRAVVGALRSWFTPLDFVRSHPGGDKGDLVYIPGEYTLAILNAFFPGSWSFDTLSREITETEAIVTGKLIVTWPDGSAQFMTSDGRSAIRYDKASKPLSIGDNYKGARTDAIKKAAAQLLGIGWDVYGGHRTVQSSPKGKREVEAGKPKPEPTGEGKIVSDLMKTHALPKADYRAAMNNHLKEWNLNVEEARMIIVKHLECKLEDTKFAGASYQTLNRYNAILLYRVKMNPFPKETEPEKPQEETKAEPTLDVETFKKLSSSLAATGLKFMVGNRSATPQIEEIIKKAHKESKSMIEALRAGLDFCAKIESWILPVKLEEELIKWGVK